MGTPEFAVASLEALYQGGFDIAAVVTAPDKPAGRGLKMHVSEVKRYACAHDIPVLQPVRLKDPVFQQQLRSFNADIQVVVAFRMLPESVWDMPPLGTVNLHASLLPAYRGAAPINWAIIRGETETGVTTFKLQHEIDTGAVIYAERVAIGPEETAGSLHDRLMKTGAELILKTLTAIGKGDYRLQPQEGLADPAIREKTAPKLFREDGRIRWDSPGATVFNLIRGLSPYPGAWTVFNGKTLKIYRARMIGAPGRLPPPGTVSSDGKTYIRIATGDGWIALDELQLEGKKKMDTPEFLRGFRDAEMHTG